MQPEDFGHFLGRVQRRRHECRQPYRYLFWLLGEYYGCLEHSVCRSRYPKHRGACSNNRDALSHNPNAFPHSGRVDVCLIAPRACASPPSTQSHSSPLSTSAPWPPASTRPGCAKLLAGPLPVRGEDPGAVIDALVAGAEPGLVATAGPRHFGFVIGGALPAALAADWLVSAWDQCAAFHSLSPAAAAIEEVASAWTLELLGLPAGAASIRHRRPGRQHDLPRRRPARHAGPGRLGRRARRAHRCATVRVLCGEQAHATIHTALRLLGLGSETAVRIPADEQGRMNPAGLRKALAADDGPAIVCVQAGNVSTGAFDAFEPIADACAAHGAWLHVDGAFGLWAAAAPATRHLTRGVERADSWAVDAHKWLNVPYDGAMAIVAEPDHHVAAMSLAGPYLVADSGQRDSTNYVPESSRRARAVPVYAAIRSLGRAGRRRVGRAQLRAGPADGGTAGRDPGCRGAQRRRPQPDTRPNARRRRRQPRRGSRHPARRNLLARRNQLAGRTRTAGVDFELDDDRRGRRPLGLPRSPRPSRQPHSAARATSPADTAVRSRIVRESRSHSSLGVGRG